MSAPSARAQPVVEVRAARKAFDRVLALDGVDLALQPGEWFALLGPNGAGKTTLMSAIAGLLQLDAGSVECRGRIGLVPQEIALYPALTARENLAVFARLHGLSGRELRERTGWALAWSGLEERANDRIETYSGGMQRRLNIACGILHRPRVVLLDEPTVGVDPQARLRIHRMLSELLEEGVTLLESTHLLGDVETFCDRVMILDRGRSLALGTPAELVASLPERTRQLSLTLETVSPGLRLHNGFRLEGTVLRGPVHDVTGELGRLFTALAESGATVHDLRLEAPDLEQVFTHLTGRRLRE